MKSVFSTISSNSKDLISIDKPINDVKITKEIQPREVTENKDLKEEFDDTIKEVILKFKRLPESNNAHFMVTGDKVW